MGVGARGRTGTLVEEPAWVSLFELERWIGRREKGTAVLGVLDAGRPVVLDLRRSWTKHLMIEAPRGWGKSTLVRTALISACRGSRPSQLGVLAIDLSERELGIGEAMPHALAEVARDVASASELLAWLGREARRRTERSQAEPHLLLAVDDLEWLCDPDQGPARADLLALLEHGGRAGIHLLGAAQPGVLRELVGRAAWSGVAIARAATRLPTGEACPRGTFVASISGGSVRFHSACLSASDLNSAARWLAGIGGEVGANAWKTGRRASLSPRGAGGWIPATAAVPAQLQEVGR